MKDSGKVSRCLSIEFWRQADTVQRRYGEAILERFVMQDCKPSVTLIKRNCTFSEPEIIDEKERNQYPYGQLISALMCFGTS